MELQQVGIWGWSHPGVPLKCRDSWATLPPHMVWPRGLSRKMVRLTWQFRHPKSVPRVGNAESQTLERPSPELVQLPFCSILIVNSEPAKIRGVGHAYTSQCGEELVAILTPHKELENKLCLSPRFCGKNSLHRLFDDWLIIVD